MDNKHHASTSKPKNKNKLLKILPKAMSFGHRVPPFSPGKDRHHNNTTTNKASFSGPMVSLVPKEVRVRRNKSDAVLDEPTSPKVSCIGQIKLGKTKGLATNKPSSSMIPKISKTFSSSSTKEDEKSRLFKVKRFFSFSSTERGNTSRKSNPIAAESVTVVSAKEVPSLGQMKKFASSREALEGFDWAIEIKREENDHRGYHSDDEIKV